ncbi:hypothetical protein PG999_012580 [Apiospora kogelbergensis]|uniref:Salicylate hydroxylase n=1 Tax=Apiospora kogelbergensis TaxID=1337665 RepID=A0AAW0QBC7_9PEZI
MGLKIIVVGGGIAGLSAAIALRRAGHEVHVYERSSFANEAGAAIHIPPNASRPLLSWGLDPVRSKFVVVRRSFRADGATLEKFHEMSHEFVPNKYGAPWFFAHRVDLHEELRRLATQATLAGGDGNTPVQIHLNSKAVEYVVKTVLGHDNPPLPQKDYNFCYRFLIPSSEIQSDPETRDWLDGDDGQMKFFVGHDKRLISYPCRNVLTSFTYSNEEHNFVAMFHNSDKGANGPEDWQASVDKAELLRRYDDFHPYLKAVMSKAATVKQWALLYREPLPTWRKGSLTLIGDAAHPMLPHQGQGGAQSIEDGVAIGILLSGATTDPEDVASRLELFESLRRNRCSAMQILSNAGQDEAERVRDEAARFIPIQDIPISTEEFVDFNFRYDVVQEAIAMMRGRDPNFELASGFFHSPAPMN